MDKLEMLWAYMQEDIAADRIDAEIKRSPLRQKLEKTRDFILEQQKIYKDMDERVSISLDRKDAIVDALKRSEEQLRTMQDRLKSDPPQDAESAHAFLQEIEKNRKTISGYEQELRHIHKEGNEFDSKSRNIRHDTAVAKQDFDRMKAVYNTEAKEKKIKYDAQRSKADSLMHEIDPDLLSIYNTVKKQITPPIAKLVDGQCSGCNTSQPSAALRKIESGAIVECETCGRILMN